MAHQGHNRQQDQMLRQQALWQWRGATQAEHERLYAMPLPDLAAEVMTRAFGPGGPGHSDNGITVAHSYAGPTVRDISELFVPDFDFGWKGPDPDDRNLRQQIVTLVSEGLQVLEHASLVRCQIHSNTAIFNWVATRYGRAVLDQGQLQAVLHGSRATPGG